MELVFEAIREDSPGAKWRAWFEQMWPAYEAWFLKEGEAARPSFATTVKMLRRHMPELVPTFERLVELAGGGDLVARCLGLYCPTPYLTGCSQVVWRGPPARLIRNYDYHPDLCEGGIWRTKWGRRAVLGMSDCLWGLLDGVNQDGLAVSLAFGGRRVVGEGFGIPLVLRYVLEQCGTTAAALGVLRRVPVNMAYNVTVVDRHGDFATAALSPDRPVVVRHSPAATNHQGEPEWEAHNQATSSVERERLLEARARDPEETAESLEERFLRAPLYSTQFGRGWGTLYTAVYNTAERAATFRWPGLAWRQTLAAFGEGQRRIGYGADGATIIEKA